MVTAKVLHPISTQNLDPWRAGARAGGRAGGGLDESRGGTGGACGLAPEKRGRRLYDLWM